MAMFARQKAQPALLKQQKTDRKTDGKTADEQHAEASVGGLILKSLRALRRKFS